MPRITRMGTNCRLHSRAQDRIRRSLVFAPLILVLAIACSSPSHNGQQGTSQSEGPTPSGVEVAGGSPPGTVGALSTLAADLTVLPDGTVVTSRGSVISSAVATEARDITSGASPGGQTTPASAPPPPPASKPPATVAPCVVQPSSSTCVPPPPEPTAIAPEAKGIVIDSDVSTDGIDTTPISAGGGTAFSIGIDVVTVPQPYQGYEWLLVINGPIQFLSSTPDKPAGLALCSQPTTVGSSDAFYSGCLSTRKDLTFAGRVDVVTLQCTGTGEGQLRLGRQGEPGMEFGTDLLNAQADPITGDVGPPIAVTCT